MNLQQTTIAGRGAGYFSEGRFPNAALALLGWLAGGLLLGTLFVLTGVKGLFAAGAIAALVVFAVMAAKFPVAAMSGCVWWLALCPFIWGVQIGFARLSVDEIPLLLYLAAFPLLYLFAGRHWQHGFAALYLALGVYLGGGALTLLERSNLVATRTFIDTAVLGAFLLVLFLQEASNSSAERVAQAVVSLTMALAVLSLVERMLKHNPLIERPDFNYPFIVRVTHGVYRPHVTFVNPSETGTFMALGVPFVVRWWLRRRSWIAGAAVGILGAAILVNATRGVWFGLLVGGMAAVLAIRGAWRWMAAAIPLGAIVASIAYLALRSTSFVRRLIDPTDLYDRFQSWRLAWDAFLAHPLLGVGPGNFSTTAIPDNMFISTMVEGGWIGLVALFSFLLASWFVLRSLQARLLRNGLAVPASLVRCSELALVIYMSCGLLADVQAFRKPVKYLFILLGIGVAEGVRCLRPGRAAETEIADEKALQLV